jgi:hypothetical protein
MSSKANLENLVRSGGLNKEPPDRTECEGSLRSAVDRLKDAHSPALSFASRFDLAYNAAHALALRALRLQGYRSGKRHLVFQCLVHTIDASKAQVRMFALWHRLPQRRHHLDLRRDRPHDLLNTVTRICQTLRNN